MLLLLPHFLLSYFNELCYSFIPTNKLLCYYTSASSSIIYYYIIGVYDKACMVALLDRLKLGQFTLILVYEVSLKDAETLFG